MAGDAYIVDAVRSPIGKRGGSLAGIRADELAAQVLNGLVDRLDVEPGEIEDVQMGCVTQVGEQALNVGRQAVLVAGWPETVAASTIDRQCGSSLQAAFNGAAAIQAGHLDVVVAAGVEHMTRVPMGSNLGDAGWGAVNEKIGERWPIVPQGISAEVLAEEWGLSREQLDAYSYESHRRAVAAIDEGRFENEIVPVEVDAAGAAVLFAVDETPRRDTSPEKLATLQPAFKADGVVTAGNSSSIVDGSAAMLLASEGAASRLGLTPRGRFVSFGLSGVDPYRMLHGNPEACAKALAKAGLTLGRRVRDRGQRGVRIGRPPVPGRHRAARALGGRRRKPERRRYLARPPARRDGRAHHRDAPQRAPPARRPDTGSRRCASARARPSRASSSGSETPSA